MKAEGLLFSYPGSKWRLAPQYQGLYPPHTRFVDVFGGSGALLARKEPRGIEVYNDLDAAVYNTIAVVRDELKSAELRGLVRNTSDSPDQYKKCKQVMADPNESPARRAWAFLVCGTIGFSGHPSVVNSWTPDHRRELRALPDKLVWWRDRLRQVCVENRPWQEIIDLYDSPDTFFFCDPPYLSQVLSSTARLYQCQMDASEHTDLIERLRTIKGYALLCGYNHPKYTELLFHWRKLGFHSRATMSSGKKRGKRLESIWLNYEEDGSKIEGNRLRIARRYIKIMGNEEEAARYVERIRRLRRLLVAQPPDDGGGH
jgi:DNA adenine methylase